MSAESLLKEAFRLTAYEARAYLALTRRGKMASKEISSAADVPMPRIYDTLSSLEERGFVEKVREKYVAVSLRTALRGRLAQFKAEFEREQSDREKAIKKVAAEFETVKPKREAPGDVVLLRGIYSIANRFLEIFTESKNVFLMVRKAVEVKGLFTAGVEVLSPSEKKVRILLPRGVRLSQSDKQLASRLGVQLRFHDTPLVDLMVADDRDVMIGVPDPFSDEPFQAVAVWVRNPSFATSVRKSLEEIWKKSFERG